MSTTNRMNVLLIKEKTSCYVIIYSAIPEKLCFRSKLATPVTISSTKLFL